MLTIRCPSKIVMTTLKTCTKRVHDLSACISRSNLFSKWSKKLRMLWETKMVAYRSRRATWLRTLDYRLTRISSCAQQVVITTLTRAYTPSLPLSTYSTQSCWQSCLTTLVGQTLSRTAVTICWPTCRLATMRNKKSPLLLRTPFCSHRRRRRRYRLARSRIARR